MMHKLARGLFLILGCLLFCQIWFDIGGMTVRAEDLLIILLWGMWGFKVLINGRFRYPRNYLNLPIFIWLSVILLGIVVTQTRPFPNTILKDSFVNGLRIIFAWSLFFLVPQLSFPPRMLARRLVIVIVGFSSLTTLVALLQIGYWDGWLPLPLPSILTQLKEGANSEPGREIFALFIGNTGAHVWTAMLALQAIVVWVLLTHTKHPFYRMAGLAYFGILLLILMRTSVRNSLLGLLIAIASLFFWRAIHSRYRFNRLFKPALFTAVAGVALLVLFVLAQESYFVQRLWVAIPQWRNGSLYIDPRSNIFGRLDYSQAAIDVFKLHPLMGGGYRSYEPLSALVADRAYIDAHNAYLQSLADFGLLGFIALLWLLGRTARYLYGQYQYARSDKMYAIVWEISGGYLLFMGFTAFFANAWGQPQQISMVAILLALLVTFQAERTKAYRQVGLGNQPIRP